MSIPFMNSSKHSRLRLSLHLSVILFLGVLRTAAQVERIEPSEQAAHAHDAAYSLPDAETLSMNDNVFTTFLNEMWAREDLDLDTLQAVLTLCKSVSGSIRGMVHLDDEMRTAYWSHYSNKQLMVLGLLSDRIRTTTNYHTREALLEEFCAHFTAEGIGNQGRACKEHLEVLFHSVFEPQLHITPQLTDGRHLVLNMIENYANEAPRTCRPLAIQFMVLAAYRVPPIRERVFEEESVLGKSEDSDAFLSMYERFLRYYGEPIPYDDYTKVRTKSTDQLLEFVLDDISTSNLWQIHYSVLIDRIDFGPESKLILSSLLSNDAFALRHSKSVLPRGVTVSAPESEREFMDFVIELLGDKLRSGNLWACEALCAVVRASGDSGKGLQSESLEPEKAYGVEKAKNILTSALSSSDPNVRSAASRCLDELH